MDHAFARDFAERWVADWNRHDLDALVRHFAEDVVWSSPVAVRLGVSADGLLRGRAALREYYATGLDLIPGLRFEVVATYVGVDTLVVNYRNQSGGLVNEVMRFRDGLVVEGHGCYLVESDEE